jgi:hypothetical protein
MLPRVAPVIEGLVPKSHVAVALAPEGLVPEVLPRVAAVVKRLVPEVRKGLSVAAEGLRSNVLTRDLGLASKGYEDHDEKNSGHSREGPDHSASSRQAKLAQEKP